MATGFGVGGTCVYATPSPPHYRFRRQYEQLQAVIVRVLRPAAPTSGSGQAVGGAATPTDQGDAGMETDDMSAVREVRLAYENVKVVDCLDLTPEGNASWEAALKRYIHVHVMQGVHTVHVRVHVMHVGIVSSHEQSVLSVWLVGIIKFSLHMCMYV